MKIIIVITIILIFGIIGYLYKKKLVNEYNLFIYLKEFNDFYNANITLFKNNIIEIVNKFIIMQNNKNAKYNKMFLKNVNTYSINKEFLKTSLINTIDLDTIISYLKNIGKGEYEFEKEKNSNFDSYIKTKIDYSKEIVKTKGDLYLKLLLAVGAILSILIW